MLADTTTTPFRTTGQAARELGIEPWQLLRFLALGRLPDVARVGSLRVWTEQDISRARELLHTPNLKASQRHSLLVVGGAASGTSLPKSRRASHERRSGPGG